ncbi:hypothetical protein QFZ56_007700 [Streptomyces achromogenes]|uniref:Transposase n=1 Tax=Streptomyces achromogenes TaxID=67255 RepID=A0ABU0QDK9_STRAH|nr:hypothetical protein [Streptomyces achromogenes]
MVHVDVKKVGRIPDGGGWRAHGGGSEQAKAADRAKARGAKAGYVYLHSASEEFLYARVWTSETQRAEAISVWNIHYNYHRPRTAVGNQSPTARACSSVTNVMASYT